MNNCDDYRLLDLGERKGLNTIFKFCWVSLLSLCLGVKNT